MFFSPLSFTALRRIEPVIDRNLPPQLELLDYFPHLVKL